MAVADLGVRVSLLDSASVGFNSLAGTLGAFGSSIVHAGNVLKGLNATQIESGSIALGAGLLFKGFGDALKWAVENGMELQDSMMRVSIAVDGADKAADQMKNTVINLADYSVFSLSEVADGFVALGEKGQDASAIMNGVGASSINLAEALNSKLVPASNLLATSMQLFGAKASEAKHYSDLLTFAFYNGIPSVQGLQQAITNAGGQAAAMGIKFDDFVVVLDALGRAMGDGSKAGTSLRYMIASLADPTSKAQKELADLGILTIHQTAPAFHTLEDALRASGKAGSDVVGQFDGTLSSLSKMFTEAQKLGLLHTDETFFQWAIKAGILSDKLYDAHGNFIGLQQAVLLLAQQLDGLPDQQKIVALQQLFNVRGGQGADALAKDLKNIREEFDKLQKKEADTSASKDAEKVTGTLSGVMKELGTTWQSVGERIGNANLGPLTVAGVLLNNLVHAFVAAPSSVHTAAAVFLVVGTVLSGLTFVIATAVFAIATIGPMLGMIATIVLPVVGAIVGLSIVIGVLVANWGRISAVLKPVGDLFHAIGTFIQNTFVKAFQDTNGVMKTGQTVMPIIRDALHQVQVTFSQLGTTLHQAQPLWTGLGIIIKIVAGLIVLALSGIVPVFLALLHGGAYLVAGLIQAFAGLIQFIVGWVQVFIILFSTFFAVLQALFSGHADRIPKILINAFHQLVAATITILTGLARFVLGILGGLVGGVTAAFLSLVVGTIAIFARLWASAPAGFRNMVVDIVHAVSQIPGQIMQALSSLGNFMLNAGKNAIQMLINGILSMIGNLGGALFNVSNVIKHFLGFASPPKGGPLADSDTYMPNMMKMYAGGILQHKHLVHGAMNDVAAGMHVAARVTASGMRAAAASGAGSSGGNNTTTIPIALDGKVVASVVLDHVTGELRQVGAGRIGR